MGIGANMPTFPIGTEGIKMLKGLLGSSLLLLLSACGTTSQFQTRSYDPTYGRVYGTALSLGPASASDPRLLDPHFYMDGDETPRWLLMMTPQSNR